MNILSICGLAIIAAVSALLLRKESPQSAILLSVGAGVIILLGISRDILSGVNEISAVMEQGGINSEGLIILLKVMGICFVTEFTCDCVSEAGMLSLSTNISFAGKVMVLFTSIPLFRDILYLITSLSGT